MEDPSILFVKPQAIAQADKDALKEAGVIVVEIDDPSAVKFIKAGSELPRSALILAAMKGVLQSNSATQQFGAALAQSLVDAATQ